MIVKKKLLLVAGVIVLIVFTLLYRFQMRTSDNIARATDEKILTTETDKVTGVATLITNLKAIISDAQSVINSNEWDMAIIEKLHNRLNEIEIKLSEDSTLKENKELSDTILEADKIFSNLKLEEGIDNYQVLQNKQKETTALLNDLKTQMGITEVVQEEIKENVRNSDSNKPISEQVEGNALSSNDNDSVQGPKIVVSEINNEIKIYTENLDQEKLKEQVYRSQGIKTIYGSHTYGCRNQEEYDAVMAKAKEAASGYSNVEFSEYYYRYMNGERPEQYPEDSWEYKCLNAVKKETGYMMMRLGNDEANKFNQVLAKASELSRNSKAQIVYTGKPNSAYDVLFRKLIDCDANAQVKSAVFDAAGYSTSVRYSDGHGWIVIKVGGIWWDVAGAPVGLTGNTVPNSEPN